jgi:acylphosphatase
MDDFSRILDLPVPVDPQTDWNSTIPIPGVRRAQDPQDLHGRVPFATKTASSYRITGPKVQGVGLRKALHKILDDHGIPGLAVNDAHSGHVNAYLEADPDRTQLALLELASSMAARGHDISVEPRKRKAPLRDVTLDDEALRTMFERQGFTDDLARPNAQQYMADWASERYRLTRREDGTLAGKVPTPAYRQLKGLAPIYEAQTKEPDRFPGQYWLTKKGEEEEGGRKTVLVVLRQTLKTAADEETDEERDVSSVDDLLGLLAPYRFAHGEQDGERDGEDGTEDGGGKKDKGRDTPFTVAVDLDGTLAEKEEPFDPRTIGPVRERTRLYVEKLHRAGARIIVWTVRGDRELVADWLEENDVPYDHINENPDQPEDSSGKVLADVYWDDRGFNAVDPDEHGPRILEMAGLGKEHGPRCVSIVRTTTILMAPEDLLEAVGADV